VSAAALISFRTLEVAAHEAKIPICESTVKSAISAAHVIQIALA
jgi:hypothetical protein